MGNQQNVGRIVKIFNMKDNILGVKLRELRIEQRVSQRRLGEILGFSNQAVSTWECGLREPDCDSLIKIAKYFNVSVDYLLGLSEI